MRPNERFAAFVGIPVTLVLGPIIAPLVVHYQNGTLTDIRPVSLLREIGDSLFLWSIVGSLYLVFLWSQPADDIAPAHKTKLIGVVSLLVILGIAQFAYSSLFAGVETY